MDAALGALAADLHVRVSVIRGLIDDLEEPAHRLADLESVCTYVDGEAAALLAGSDPDPQGRQLAYDLANEDLVFREQFELPFVVGRDKSTLRATRLCHELCRDIGWPWETPIVKPFSTAGFWTFPRFLVVAVPIGEEARLLAVPDLVHELGHLALAHTQSSLVGDLYDDVATTMKGISKSCVPHDMSRNDFVDELLFAWQEGWLSEIICDLIATYCMGAAFAWQHIRLWAQEPLDSRRCPEWVRLEDVHPPDGARMRAVQCLIQRLGFDEPAGSGATEWTEIVSQSVRPDSRELFDAVFPLELLDTIGAHVAAACNDLGLVRFALRDLEHIPTLVHRAWAQAIRDPNGFAGHEAQAAQELWSRWDL